MDDMSKETEARMTPAPDTSWLEHPAYVHVARTGWITYTLEVRCDGLASPNRAAFTSWGANRKAARMLRRALRRAQWEADAVDLRASDLPAVVSR